VAKEQQQKRDLSAAGAGFARAIGECNHTPPP